MAVNQCCPSRLNPYSGPNFWLHFQSEPRLFGFAASRAESVSVLTLTSRWRAWHAGRARLRPNALRESTMVSMWFRPSGQEGQLHYECKEASARSAKPWSDMLLISIQRRSGEIR
jgi:hypothetical protein